MDGTKFVVPYSCGICIGCEKNNYKKHNGIYCKIMNWETNRRIKYITLLDRRKNGSK